MLSQRASGYEPLLEGVFCLFGASQPGTVTFYVHFGAFIALSRLSCMLTLKAGLLPMQESQTDGLSQDP